MKPIGMDKNGVLVYEGDIVLHCDETKSVKSKFVLDDFVILEKVNEIKNRYSSITYSCAKTNTIEVVNVSDRTNHERYFADLCSMGQIFKYICAGTHCHECIANDSMCSEDLVLNEWLNESAVKL